MTKETSYYCVFHVKTFEGNTKDNKNNGVVRDFPEMVYAKGIRILPQNWTTDISVRFDVHGCFWGM